MFKYLDPDPHSEAGSKSKGQIGCGSGSATLVSATCLQAGVESGHPAGPGEGPVPTTRGDRHQLRPKGPLCGQVKYMRRLWYSIGTTISFFVLFDLVQRSLCCPGSLCLSQHFFIMLTVLGPLFNSCLFAEG